MAGARARKLDLSGYLSGNANVANLIVQGGEAQARGIAGLFGGIAGGISQAGQNVRVDKQRADAKAERDEERTYQRGRDAFSQRLALKADARADADQALQEDAAKRQVAAQAMSVEETVNLLNRAKAAQATGMPMDPKVLDGIKRNWSSIMSAGGPAKIMALASQSVEPDLEGLIGHTAQLESLSKLLTAQMGREKDPVRHAALGDSVMQMAGIVSANKYRIRLHEANVNRAATAETNRANAEYEAKRKEMESFDASMDRIDERDGAPTETVLEPGTLFGTPTTRVKAPKSAAAADERLRIARGESGPEASPEEKGVASARQDIAKDSTLRKAGIETPAAGRERAERDRAFKADETKFSQALDKARADEADAEADRSLRVAEAGRLGKPMPADERKVLDERVAKARKARDEAYERLQGHQRGGALEAEVASIENDAALSAEEKLKRLDALEAKRAGR